MSTRPRHLALPLAVAPGGTLAALPLGSPAEVTQSVAVLLATVPGERRCEPAYGTPDPLFAGVDPAAVLAAVADWEPRARARGIDLAGTVAQHLTVPVTTIREALA